jgi:hypothetical protein
VHGCTLRDGKIIKSMDYLSHQEALEAVGLSESDKPVA